MPAGIECLPGTRIFSMAVLGLHIQVDSTTVAVSKLLASGFGGMPAPGSGRPPDLEYAVTKQGSSYSIRRPKGAPLRAANRGDLLFQLEKDITVELQLRRADLFFLHSAAVEWRGRAYLLAAESGWGKSTTTWPLLHHGFGYLSDELSAVDLESMQVHSYPHALCLKQDPPQPCSLPDEAIRLAKTIHLPAQCLPGSIVAGPLPLGGLFLLSHSPGGGTPNLRPVSAAEASACVYVIALNALVHPNRGLDAVVRIAGHVPSFALTAADLPQTCTLIRSGPLIVRVGSGCHWTNRAPA